MWKHFVNWSEPDGEAGVNSKPPHTSFDCLPFELCAALAGRAWTGSSHRNRPWLVGLGVQIAMVDQRHEHSVAPHQIDPLEGFRIARILPGKVFQYHGFFSGGDEPAVSNLQCNAPLAEVNDLETHIGRLRIG